jgi:hypothetical protein
VAKAGGGGGRSGGAGGGGGGAAQVRSIRNSEGMVLGYSVGGSVFSSRTEAKAASLVIRTPGAQFMSASQLRAASSGVSRRASAPSAGRAFLPSASERGAERMRLQEKRDVFRARL